MDDALLVRRRQPGAELLCDLEDLRRREVSDALQQGREVFAVDELHRQEMPAVDFVHVVDAADVVVRDLARRADFRVEAFERRRPRHHRLGQELQRDRLAEPEIVGAIHLAHAADAEQADDPEPLPEHRAGGESPGRDPIGRPEATDVGRRGHAAGARRQL